MRCNSAENNDIIDSVFIESLELMMLEASPAENSNQEIQEQQNLYN